MEGQQMYMCAIRLNANSSNSLLDYKIVFNVKYTCCTIFLSLSSVRVEGKLQSIVAGCMQGNYMQTLTMHSDIMQWFCRVFITLEMQPICIKYNL